MNVIIRTLCFTVIFFSFSFPIHTRANNSFNRMVVKYVDLDILTTVNVSCKDFEYIFKDELNEKEINSRKDIQELVDILKELKIDHDVNQIDVRLKIVLFSPQKNESIYIDRYNVLRNGKLYKINNQLIRQIEKALKVKLW